MNSFRAEDLLRHLTPQVLGALVRRYGHFDLAEDATQEAMLAAANQWPRDGMPANPKAWLITVASRRLSDLLRAEQARRRREDTVAHWAPTDYSTAEVSEQAEGDDTLVLLFLCCHPSLSVASQIALTLRAVGGLSVAEIARALLSSEQTVTRRITRAKQSIKDSGLPFALPTEASGRLDAVLRVLYLIFNEGYASTTGTQLMRLDLTEEAIRLTRILHTSLPDDAEVSGLLALMLLTHARSRARTGADGSIIPMAVQDRRLWDRAAIEEGVALLTAALPQGPTGPYQIQAAIAAVHDEADAAGSTDWAQIAALYGVLLRLDDNPIIALNHAVAVSMISGPRAGLSLLGQLEDDVRVASSRRFHAVRAQLLERDGDLAGALDAYYTAASYATNTQQKRYLNQQIARLEPLRPMFDELRELRRRPARAGFTVRPYRPDDAAAIPIIFHRSVREVASADYSEAQVAAWSPTPPDYTWVTARANDGRSIFVAVDQSDKPVGYIDVEVDGHIDHLYCLPEAVCRGVGTQLYAVAEMHARRLGIRRLYVEASEPARRMFERQGFSMLERRELDQCGTPIHNYLMEKTLGA